MENKIYLKGLNTLRFIAAVLVVFGHARQHLYDLKISWHPHAEVLRQAGSAVKFFFVLSGFLLTMLALRELKSQNFIDLKSFYLRRILRIFPLYYAVLVALFIINAGINPILLHKNTLGQPIVQGFLLNAFMFPNLAKAIWPTTVGALGLLWSIGVEEQFYLFFPHMMNFLKKIKYKFLFLVLIYTILSTFFRLVEADIIHLNPIAKIFVDSLKFNYMLMGCMFSYIIFGTNLSKTILSVMDIKLVQLVIYIVAFSQMFFNILPSGFIGSMLESMLFGIVIISVSCTSNNLINFEIKPFSHWGAISYGIYLLHPFVAYVLRFAFIKIHFIKNLFTTTPDLYPVILLLLTIGLAHLSYSYYESPFLKLKDKMNKQYLTKLLKSKKSILAD